MSNLKPDQIAHLKKLLLQEKEELQASLDSREPESLRDSLGELSTSDNHPADSGTELFERSRDLALDDTESERLAEIEAALARIEEGTYGICEASGEPIPYERLEALPWTRFTVEHSDQQEVSDSRPVEEEVMVPGRGVVSPNSLTEDSQRDDDDAWRTVEEYGNSDSPAMADNPDRFRYTDKSGREADGDGYVEPLETFTVTDIDGGNRRALRGPGMRDYVRKGEGDESLQEPPSKEPPR